MYTRSIFLLLILALSTASFPACGNDNSDPVGPADSIGNPASCASRQLWGLWDVEVIPDGAGSAELVFTPLRSSQLHLNVVGLLEGSGQPAVGIDPPISFVDGILDVDIRLTHPFDVVKFCGFDVRGIMIGHGAYAGFSHSLFYAGPDDIQLLNADGHSRLWNPTDYSGKGYIDGKLGQPDALENFTATLNGYKYFAKGLLPDMSVADMPKDDRGVFLASSSNARHYKIRLGDKDLTFQYAIDANWWKPTQPVEVPDSFDIERANCPEPYYISVYIEPGIMGTGGSAEVVIDVYDWQKDCNQVTLEAPLLLDTISVLANPDDMGDFVRFTTTLTNENLPSGEFADVLIHASGIDPESSVTYYDYRLFRLPLPRVPTGGVVITIQDDMAYKTIGVEYVYGGTGYDYDTGPGAPVDYDDTVGPWDFTPVPNEEGGNRAALAKDDPEVADFADTFNPAVTHLWRTEWLMANELQQIYQAEVHNTSIDKLRLWGIYEQEVLDGAVDFDDPIDFDYPMDTSTHYSVSNEYWIFPVMLSFKISFERWGIGEGIAFVPVEPGLYGWGWETQACLLTRTIASFETGGLLGQGPLGDALIYEWIADDGTTYGSIMAGNDPGGPPNFDDATYEIIGLAGAQVLRSID